VVRANGAAQGRELGRAHLVHLHRGGVLVDGFGDDGLLRLTGGQGDGDERRGETAD
jgi:hypothetical protein